MSENYIVINGKRAELTEAQLKQLGIEVPKANPFERSHGNYYFITSYGNINEATEKNSGSDSLRHEAANYCTDKAIMEQRALYETLHRLLWRYAMENGGEGNYEICHNGNEFLVKNTIYKYFGQTFSTYKIAQSAIKEIVEPFMKEHPEFKW